MLSRSPTAPASRPCRGRSRCQAVAAAGALDGVALSCAVLQTCEGGETLALAPAGSGAALVVAESNDGLACCGDRLRRSITAASSSARHRCEHANDDERSIEPELSVQLFRQHLADGIGEYRLLESAREDEDGNQCKATRLCEEIVTIFLERRCNG